MLVRFQDDGGGRVEAVGAEGLPGGVVAGDDDSLIYKQGAGQGVLVEVNVDVRVAIEDRDDAAVGGRAGFAGDNVFDAQKVVAAGAARRRTFPIKSGIGQGEGVIQAPNIVQAVE